MGRRPIAGWRSGMTALTAAAPGPGLGGAAAGGAPHIVVAGGGLAGIAAAIALRDGGARVTLLEARPRLGGATCSFSRGGLTVDNGQHIFLRCCTAYRGLLDRLGMTANTVLQERFDVRVLAPRGAARLRRRALPAPFHLASALATYQLLSRRERVGAVRAALAFRRLDPADPRTDKQRLGDWLAAHGQGPRARRALWDLFIVSALNIAGDDASLALASMVIKTALLGGPGAADIGVPSVPLGELHGQSAGALLRRLGATVLTGAKVTSISPGAGGSGRRGGRGDHDHTGGFMVRLGAAAAYRDPGPEGTATAGLGHICGSALHRTATKDTAAPDTAAPDTAATDTAATDTAATDTAATDTAATDTAVTDTAATDTAVTDTAATDTAATDTAATDPAATDPAATDPAMNETAATDPAATDTAIRKGLIPGSASTDGAASGRFLTADGVVLAVPPEQAAILLPESAAGPAGTAGYPGGWRELGESPIVNVHVVYDRPVTSLPFAAAIDSPVQWIFDRTEISGCDQGQYLALSLSAADHYAGERTQRLRARFLPALEQLLPAARAAHVSDFFVTRERRATFRQVPGTAALRPGAATPLDGLVLAGAWTNTGWPDTMEGAVRSGLEAARTMLANLGVRR